MKASVSLNYGFCLVRCKSELLDRVYDKLSNDEYFGHICWL